MTRFIEHNHELSREADNRQPFGIGKDLETEQQEVAALVAYMKNGYEKLTPSEATLKYLHERDANYDLLIASCRGDLGRGIFERARLQRRAFWEKFYLVDWQPVPAAESEQTEAIHS